MRPSVRSAVLPWYSHFEGCPQDKGGAYCYVDVVNVVTVGFGFALFNAAAAYQYPWKDATGANASMDLVSKDYATLHTAKNPKKLSAPAFASMTTMRLALSDVTKIFYRKIDAYEAEVKKGFPDYDKWPAGAQLALLDMAWAMGTHFWHTWPKFTAAMNTNAFMAASLECKGKGEPKARTDARVALLTGISFNDVDTVPWKGK